MLYDNPYSNKETACKINKSVRIPSPGDELFALAGVITNMKYEEYGSWS